MEAIQRVLTVAGSGTALGDEYAAVKTGLARIGPTATTFDRGAYDPRAVAMALEMWRQRMAFEHRSTAVFAALAMQLMEANASLDAKVVMLRMAQDELRHTETCAGVVVALGGAAEVPTDVAVAPLARHRGCSPEGRALRNVIYTTCMSEMVAVARFVDTLDHTTDAFMRDANRALLTDEVLHGQFGFHYLEAWRPWLAAHPDEIAQLNRYLRHAFAVIEGILGGAPDPTAPAATADELAIGLTDSNRSRDVFYGTMEGAIVPGLDRFGLDATDAWRRRAREDGVPVAAETLLA
jgi:hypothetical protein